MVAAVPVLTADVTAETVAAVDVTTSWHLHGFSGPPNDARHGNGSGSAISIHQFSAEMLKHKVSITSLHWQTGLQTQKGHALTQWH